MNYELIDIYPSGNGIAVIVQVEGMANGISIGYSVEEYNRFDDEHELHASIVRRLNELFPVVDTRKLKDMKKKFAPYK
jgi:hypothetical protein